MPDYNEQKYELFLQESLEKFSAKLLKHCTPVNSYKPMIRTITGAEKIAKVLSRFCSIGEYLNVEESKTREGVDPFNMISLDPQSKILQIGYHEICKNDEDFNHVFMLIPKQLFFCYNPAPEESLLVLTNKPRKKTDSENLFDSGVSGGGRYSSYTSLLDVVNPILIYPAGSRYNDYNCAPAFLDELIKNEELENLLVK